MSFSKEQKLFLDYFNSGENIFITGPGGSGKTFMIREIFKRRSDKNINICALTGCAAILLECKAKTVHSWAGIGLATEDIDSVVTKVVTNKYKRKNWEEVDILIIDEVSMMSQKLFDILDLIGRELRDKTKPFGGIQLIFSGDFYQLPPIGTNGDPDTRKFCFESEQWTETFKITIEFKTIFRQTDPDYIKILNEVRVGKITESSVTVLSTHLNKIIPENIQPPILHPKRYLVENINRVKLQELKGNKHTYSYMHEYGKKYSKDTIDREVNFLINNMMPEKILELKIGAHVMCVVNLDIESHSPIINGSQGIVIDFIDLLPLIQFNCGRKMIIDYYAWKSEKFTSICVKQIPLILSWAITIHKAQGLSLECAQINIGNNIFANGQTYVALSRIKSLIGLYLTEFDYEKIQVDKRVTEFYSKIEISY